MKLRDTLVVAGLIAAIAAIALLMGGFGASAAETPPAEIDVESAPEPSRPDDLPSVPVAPVGPAKDTKPRGDDRERDNVPDGMETWTSGVIEGRVSMASRLRGKVTHFHVRLTELANAKVAESLGRSKPLDRIWKKAFQVPERSTPRFRLEDVPFSKHGYRVEILANGANGSSAIARIDQESPYADVTVGLSSPVLFTVRLRDQFMNPHGGWSLQLRPVGDPPGRKVMNGETDRFGVAMIDDVVRGDYVVWSDGRELDRITVQAITIPRVGQPIRVQSATVVVPTGRDLRVEVFGVTGHGLADVSLELHKTDTTENRRFEAKTDFGGIYTFEHLEAGRYQLKIFGDRLQRTSRTVRIPAEGIIEPMRIRLVPTR